MSIESKELPVNPIFMMPEIQEIAKEIEEGIVNWRITHGPPASSLANEFIGRIIQAVESTVAAKLISEPISAEWLNKTHGGVLPVGDGCEIVEAGTKAALIGSFERLEYQRSGE